MIAGLRRAPSRPSFAFPAAARNPVLLTLVIAAAAAAASFGFIGYAPNRLVSGGAIPLWAAAGELWTTSIGLLGALLLLACVVEQRRALHYTVAIASALLLILVLAAAGQAAGKAAAGAPPASRVSLGPAFWVLATCAALAAADALQRIGAGKGVQLAVAAAIVTAAVLLAFVGSFDALSLAREYSSHRAAFAGALERHMILVASSVGAALAIGFPLGVMAAKSRGLRGPIFASLNILQTIPSIALFGLLIVPLSALVAAAPRLAALGIGGIGVAPALIALVLYALLPIVRSTAAGLGNVDLAVVEAGRGMGLSDRQIFWRVELPLAAPVWLAGLRVVTVQAIGLAVVAALIGAGGLGAFVWEGLGQYAVDLVLLGALPAIFLALAADFVLQIPAAVLRRWFAP